MTAQRTSRWTTGSRRTLGAAAIALAAAWLGIAASESRGSAAAASDFPIAGAEIVWASGSVAPGQRAGVSAECSSGKVVLSGGFVVPQGDSLDVYRSLPVGSNRWVVGLDNSRGLFQGPAVTFRAYALCVKASAALGREVVSSTYPTSGPGFKSREVSCPAGKVASGGGFSGAKHDPAPAVLGSRHSSTYYSDSWHVRLVTRGYAVELPTWVVFAICVDDSGYSVLDREYDDTTVWAPLPRNVPVDLVATCPSGSVMVGGEFSAQSYNGLGLQFVRVSTSYPLSLRSWRSRAQYTPPSTSDDFTNGPRLVSSVVCFEPR